MTSPITTHVLDTASGKPASGVPVRLEKQATGGWALLGEGQTDADGRLRTLLADRAAWTPGVYRLTFETGRYFAALGVDTFYPEVPVLFEVRLASEHYHVPLLISPFGYATYRGS